MSVAGIFIFMGKRVKKSSLKFLCAIGMSLFSLIALFAGTMAWFTSMRITHNAADNFDVDKSSLTMSTTGEMNSAWSTC